MLFNRSDWTAIGRGLRTVRGRLLLLILLSIIPETWLSFNDAIKDRRLALGELHHDARQFVEFAALQEKEIIGAGKQLLRSMASEPEITSSASESACRQKLGSVLRIHPQYVNFHVLRADGTPACSAKPLPKDFSAAGEGYFREALSSGRLAISDYEFSASRGIGELVLALPVPEGAGRPEHVITAALDLSWLARTWSHARLPEGSVLTVVDRNGVVLARYPDPGRWAGTAALKNNPAFSKVLAAGGKIDVDVMSLDGVHRIFAYEPIRSALSAIYVGVGIPVEAAHRRVEAMFYQKLLLTGAGAIVLFGLAWWGTRRFLLRPLAALTSAAGRLERGDPGARAGVPGDGSEFGQLAHAFDRMAEGIESRERRVEAAVTDLARTNRALRTLSASNQALIRGVNEQQLMEDICRAAVEQGRYRMAWVGWAEHDEAKTIRSRAHAGNEAGFLATLALTWADTERGRGTSGETIRTGRTTVLNDALAEATVLPWREEMRARGFLSVLSLPLRLDGDVVGVLTIYGDEPQMFTPEAVTMLEELAGDLSFGLASLRLRQREQEARESLRRIAYYDTVTGLPNRARLREKLEEAVAAAGSGNRSLALILLSLDNFREIVNTLGLRQGEQLLVKLAPRLERVAQDTGGTLAHMQTGEFALLLPDSGAERAAEAAQKLLLALQEPAEASGTALYVHGSAGIALYPGHAEEPSLLLRRAGAALDQARRSGGHVFYSSALDEGAPARLAMAADLNRAIDAGELLIYCQPKILLATRRVCGAEALVRWRHPGKGLISPAQFIPLAEHTGLIKPLTYRVMSAAARQCRAWREAGLALPLAVNLSARNLRDPRLIESIEGLFATWGIVPGEFEIEITESTLMDDPAGAKQVIARLHAMGIPLYIDDFGTGYSSLAYLEQLRVDAIKIDQSFVAGMAASEGAAKIVRSTIELAHNLGMKVVAEGIETPQALERLAEMGCDSGQGYLIARPMPADEVSGWLASSPWR